MEDSGPRRRPSRLWAGFLAAAFVVAFSLPAAGSASTFRKTWSFERDPAGDPPPVYTFALTGHGAPGRWAVIDTSDAPSGRHVLAQLAADTTSLRFPLAIEDTLLIQDLRLAVKCRLVSGHAAQACGLVFRYQDPSNYYLARADAREGTICLFYVKDGVLGEMKCRQAPVTLGAWHEMRVEARGYHFEVFWDGRKVVAASDAKITDTGRVGLLTRADTIAEFDDLAVEPPE